MQDKPTPHLDDMVNRLFKALPAGMRDFAIVARTGRDDDGFEGLSQPA